MEFIRQPLSEQNPSKQQLMKLQKLLKNKRDDLIESETGKIGQSWYEISSLVRNKIIFQIVMTILNFYPISSSMFESNYFSAEYKKWILTEYPGGMMKKCLNKCYVMKWAAKYFSLDYCTYLNSLHGYDCTEIMFESFVKEKKFFEAMALLERVSSNKPPSLSTSFDFLPRQYCLHIFGSGNLKFIVAALPYVGFDASTLKPTVSFRKELEKWSKEQSEEAKKFNNKEMYDGYGYDSDYDSDENDYPVSSNMWDSFNDEYDIARMEGNKKVIYQKEYERIESNLLYHIRCSSFNVFKFFLKINKNLNGDEQTFNAFTECDVKRLEQLEELSKLEFGMDFYWQLKIPKGDSRQVIQVLDLIERKGCELLQVKKKKYAEGVQDKEIADYLVQKGFTIEPTFEWVSTQDYIDWCFSRKQEPKWSNFLFHNMNLGFILDVFEKGKKLGFAPQDYLCYLDNHTILNKNVSVKDLDRLLALGYDFLQLKGYILRIYGAPKHFFQFLIDKCLPKDKRELNKIMEELKLDRIHKTSDIGFHEFLYNSGFYDEHTNKEYSNDFDMWSYPIEENNIELIKWVKSKGYKAPSKDCWWSKCTPETLRYLEDFVFI